VTIPAVTTSVGTYPKGSMWRKNPIPMCNCDLGFDCYDFADDAMSSNGDKDMFRAYNRTHFRPGQTSKVCPTGVQFEMAVDEAAGAPPYSPGKMSASAFDYQMVDKLTVPTDLAPGAYVLSWRWDCEAADQVWNSCADLTIA